MHDPEVVVFEVKRPWPKRVNWGKRHWYWPAVVTIWHVEPKGADSGTICKGMGGSEWSWRNVKFAVRHWRHLHAQVIPYQRVRNWLFQRCAECGRRFFWKDDRTGYMSSDDAYHGKCMELRHTRSQLDDLTKYVRFTADWTERWRVERRLGKCSGRSHWGGIVSAGESTFEGSEERPLYRKVPHEDGWATQLYMIVCDEGWRESIVCDRMYGWAADWLLRILGNTPYASVIERAAPPSVTTEGGET